MREDEDMLNVGLWRDNADKDWCKFDLEPDLFRNVAMQKNQYWDLKWYPQGVPMVFIAMHNTKVFNPNDWLLSFMAKCYRDKPELRCRTYDLAVCKDGSAAEKKLRLTPWKYIPTLCCCIQPRMDSKVYWDDVWYRDAIEAPIRVPNM